MTRDPLQARLIPTRESTDGDEFRFALIRTILDASPDGILVVNDRDRIVTHNQRMLQVWDVQGSELPGARDGSAEGIADHHLLSCVLSRVADPDAFLARVKELYTNPEAEDHCEIELKDGRTLERHSTGLWNQRGKYLDRVWFFRDITSRKRTEAALMDLAQTDPLTGVANLRQFLARANEEFVRAKRFGRQVSIVIVDIDHFKTINDRWGHATGDEVLKTLCRMWTGILRQVDLLARVGGEEFAWLLTETGQKSACNGPTRPCIGPKRTGETAPSPATDHVFRDATPRVPADTTYVKECGACHFGCQPGLLPECSWRKLFGRRRARGSFWLQW
ncbi:MAG TPA: diguanylate cyclase [Nitrospiria bacterium]|nr:diguanylate cyclase [Nitrospiria bacterium]